MADVTIPVTRTLPSGVVVTPVNVTTADTGVMVNDGRTTVLVKNIGAFVATATFITTKLEGGGLTVQDQGTGNIAVGDEEICGPFETGLYGSPLTFTVAGATLAVRAIRA
jgi:hypothetical protein